MNINHIVTLGCSFTYCQGLPIEQGWPYLLAKKLNCNLVNLAVPGIGNDAIHRKLYEYLYDDLLIENSKPLVIIAWSQEYRHESWQRVHYLDDQFHDYAPVSLPNDQYKAMTFAQHDFLENFNEKNFYRKTLLYKASVINLLKQCNIPYIMSDSFISDYNVNKYLGLTETYKGLDSASRNDTNFITSIQQLCGMPKHHLPCGHYTYEACQLITDFMIDAIDNLYPNLNYVVDNNFYQLSEYIKKDKYQQKFPEWCNFTL